MIGIKGYGSSSDNDSESENTEDSKIHLKPIENTDASVKKNMLIEAAPDVVPLGAVAVPRAVDPSTKELAYNPKFDELFAPVHGPENPFLTEQMRAQKNTLSGYVEKAHVNAFQFENQRRTFHTYGYALDPTVDAETIEGQNYVGDLQSAYDTDGKTVFEAPKPKKKKTTRKK